MASVFKDMTKLSLPCRELTPGPRGCGPLHVHPWQRAGTLGGDASQAEGAGEALARSLPPLRALSHRVSISICDTTPHHTVDISNSALWG